MTKDVRIEFPGWALYTPGNLDDLLGGLPYMLSISDPRSAREQFDANYQHGGGWRPMEEWRVFSTTPPSIQYPGDPVLPALASTSLRDERIFLYTSAWVMILQPNGDFEVARMD